MISNSVRIAVAWRGLSDHSPDDPTPGQLVLLCQCGIGQDWADKTISVPRWSEVILFGVPPTGCWHYLTFLLGKTTCSTHGTTFRQRRAFHSIAFEPRVRSRVPILVTIYKSAWLSGSRTTASGSQRHKSRIASDDLRLGGLTSSHFFLRGSRFRRTLLRFASADAAGVKCLRNLLVRDREVSCSVRGTT